MEYLNTKEFAEMAGLMELTLRNYNSRKRYKFPKSKKIKGVNLWLKEDCIQWVKTRDLNVLNSGRKGGIVCKEKVNLLSKASTLNSILRVMAR